MKRKIAVKLLGIFLILASLWELFFVGGLTGIAISAVMFFSALSLLSLAARPARSTFFLKIAFVISLLLIVKAAFIG